MTTSTIDTTVRFVVTLHEQKMKEAKETDFYKKFKLEGYINTFNMVKKHYD